MPNETSERALRNATLNLILTASQLSRRIATKPAIVRVGKCNPTMAIAITARQGKLIEK